ncbi:acyltransferase family protein [Aurantimicrobium minutum]|uniref:acyltransferase family protein n=1 Tax=Aurantimicrobium minutum TaxID=708131 RepID=UPI001E5031D3|nr:acyltransferase [Aurantimicrobium minutum]
MGGFGTDPGRDFNNLGILAVECFFAISGYLITKSALNVDSARFIWHRIIRIFPAYWFSLLVVTGVFAPVVWRTTQGLSSYLTSANPPALGFILNNFFLVQGQIGIGGTLSDNPFPSMWNGPLYTLYWEFLCYVGIALLAATRLLNLKILGLITGISWIYLQIVNIPALVGQVDDRSAKFILMFAVGSLVFFLRSYLLDLKKWWIPTSALIASAVTYFFFGFEQLGILTLGLFVLWVGLNVRFLPNFGGNDYSYGVYLFGWPVQQTATFFGVTALGILPYFAICATTTYLLAFLSWHLLEKKILKLKSADLCRFQNK